MPLSVIVIQGVITIAFTILMLIVQRIAPLMLPFAFLFMIVWLFYVGLQYKDVAVRAASQQPNKTQELSPSFSEKLREFFDGKPPTNPTATGSALSTVEGGQTTNNQSAASAESPSPTPQTTSAREILFQHIAQERANLEARGATTEQIDFLDQFSARLAARFDSKSK